MPQPAVLLDTDILSELLKQHPLVVQRVQTYLADHERLAFSIITRYELLRADSRPNRPEPKKPHLLSCVRPV